MRQNRKFDNFGVIGGGAWGTALASALARAGRSVSIWAREAEVVEGINKTHENTTFLRGVKLDPAIKAVSSLGDVAGCDAWILVVPVQHTRDVCGQLNAFNASGDIPIVICSKGVEQNTLALPSIIIQEIMPGHPLAVMSGPTFAVEIARGLPAAVTLACEDRALGEALSQAVSCRAFRPYYCDDVIGAQLGGAIKNVLAIACGIILGQNMGDNARAALITRGLAEVMRLGAAMGGKMETLMGLSGLGDLVLTCSSVQSRNMSLGVALGQGKSLADIIASRNSVTEGVYTAAAAVALAKKHKVDMPIVFAVDAILNHGAVIDDTIRELMARPLKLERS
ncbi:MAG: NAD(P)-dependent glycerol-3-phosphate dehydrogenase [Alphaproteobacteria bacterium]|nr:NAD(P)-dependent glycerol-3-phosphate dehydrogenase [Alphaproteobacteria bacterium]